MSKELERIKKLMAKRMVSYKLGHRVRVPTKSAAHALFKAKVNKKDLPHVPVRRDGKDPEFAKLSIEEFEKKYL